MTWFRGDPVFTPSTFPLRSSCTEESTFASFYQISPDVRSWYISRTFTLIRLICLFTSIESELVECLQKDCKKMEKLRKYPS